MKIRRTISSGFAVWMALTAWACAPDQRLRGWDLAQREGVTLKDLKPAAQASLSRGHSDFDVLKRYRLHAELMVFPRMAAPLKLLTAQLEPAPVDGATGRRWAANGFGLGVIDNHRVGLFKANLSGSLDTEMHPIGYTVLNAVAYTPLELTGASRTARRVRISGAEGRISERQFDQGRFRFLVKLDAEGETVRLDLMPQHHRPASELVPRSPQERILDGTAFMDLRLVTPVLTSQTWVFWADLPEPAVEENRTVHLAEALLSGYRRNRPVQAVMLLRIDPEEGSSSGTPPKLDQP